MGVRHSLFGVGCDSLTKKLVVVDCRCCRKEVSLLTFSPVRDGFVKLLARKELGCCG